jgi:hypothetical protein
MKQELLILPEHPWFIVEFVNTLIVPDPLVSPVVFTNSTINQGCSGRINSSCVTLLEQELLILAEHTWFIVEFVNTTGDTNEAGTINPSGASLVYSRVREHDG